MRRFEPLSQVTSMYFPAVASLKRLRVAKEKTFSISSYNAVGELLDLNNAHGTQTLLSDYNLAGAGHYDGAGNLLGLTANLPAAPASYSGTSLYQYDTHDQLTDEQTPQFGTSAFAYDAAGNPTTFKTATGQTFSADNQNTAIGYDLDGNPMSWGTTALSFDTASHLTSVGTELTAGYNAEGLRAWKQSAAGSTYFVYDGLTPIAEANSSGTVTAVNTWGAAGLLSRRNVSSGSSTFYTFDVQGSTSQRLDLNGNVLGSYSFDAYGTRASTDNSSDPYTGFGAQWGYYRDAETGLSLLGHRYYDPSQGRFLNRDPIGYDGGLNLYSYAANNPMSFVDPSGLWSLYRWMYTGDGDASDEVYNAAIDQGADTLNRWWCHFKQRNRRQWPMVAGAAAAGTLPYWSVPKPPGTQRANASPNTSLARLASLPQSKGGWLPDALMDVPGFNQFIRKPILVRLASEVKADYKGPLGPFAPLKGAFAGAMIAEAILAWQATFDTLGDQSDE
jgi:RHS repeat-associated protein